MYTIGTSQIFPLDFPEQQFDEQIHFDTMKNLTNLFCHQAISFSSEEENDIVNNIYTFSKVFAENDFFKFLLKFIEHIILPTDSLDIPIAFNYKIWLKLNDTLKDYLSKSNEISKYEKETLYEYLFWPMTHHISCESVIIKL